MIIMMIIIVMITVMIIEDACGESPPHHRAHKQKADRKAGRPARAAARPLSFAEALLNEVEPGFNTPMRRWRGGFTRYRACRRPIWEANRIHVKPRNFGWLAGWLAGRLICIYFSCHEGSGRRLCMYFVCLGGSWGFGCLTTIKRQVGPRLRNRGS